MAVKLRNNSKTLSKKQFSFQPKGYDALEVDSVLDKIIKDYVDVENNVLLTKEEYDALKSENDELKKKNIQLELDLENEKNKWKYVKSDGKDIHIDNLVLLKRIGRLEKIIYDKLHMNPDDVN